jgi:hypothetical protein
MATLRLSQVIDRPAADVFLAIIDLESFPRWNPTTKSARKLSPGETGEGSTFELAIRGFGTTIQELRGFERDRRVTLVPHLKALSGGHTFVLTPQGGHTRRSRARDDAQRRAECARPDRPVRRSEEPPADGLGLEGVARAIARVTVKASSPGGSPRPAVD